MSRQSENPNRNAVESSRCHLEQESNLREDTEDHTSCHGESEKEASQGPMPEETVRGFLRQLLRIRSEHLRRDDDEAAADGCRRKIPQYQDIIEHALSCAHNLMDFLNAGRLGSECIVAGNSEDRPSPTVEDGEPVPAKIGRYRIIRRIGAGGFGKVFLAHDEKLQKDVAVKLANRRGFGSNASAKQLLSEARHAAKLDHPGVIPVYDVHDEGERPYIVMKFIDGQTLSEWFQISRPPYVEIVRMLIGVGAAVGFAHRHSIIHRDLKPTNILVDPQGKTHVVDFGLALRLEARDSWKGTVSGTCPYMSPEQVRGEANRIDGRSDIWSLGVILYEMLADRRPFSASSHDELFVEIATADPTPPRKIESDIPPELERICLKCLEKRRSRRYATVSELIDDLEQWLGTAETQKPFAARPVRVVPRGLRSFDANDAEFFLDLVPGTRDRNGLPESIRFWKTRIEEARAEQTFSVGLIYGPSGSGKTSLVKAGLLPRLAPQVIAVYVEATAADTESSLLRALRKKVLPNLPSDAGLVAACALIQNVDTSHPTPAIPRQSPPASDLTEAQGPIAQLDGQTTPATEKRAESVSSPAEDYPAKVIIILDQFEQWLHSHPAHDDAELVRALRLCDGSHLQAIAMVRDDFAMAAARFMQAIDVRIVEGDNFATTDLFDLQHAEKVLTRFGQAYGRLPEQSDLITSDETRFVSSAVADLAQDCAVTPVRLALFAEMVKRKRWTRATLRGVGGTTGIGVSFLDEAFNSRSANPRYRVHEQAARGVLNALIPEAVTGIKRQVRGHKQLMSAAGYTQRPQEFQELLRILNDELRLITPTDPEGVTEASRRPPGDRQYQLTHDYLVPALQEWLMRKQRETRRGRAELRFTERTALWVSKPQKSLLPTLWEYLSFLALTRHRGWTTSQAQMMRVAAKYFVLRFSLLTFALLAIGLSVYEVTGRFQATALVNNLLNADEGAALEAADELRPYLRWAKPHLDSIVSMPPANKTEQRQQLHVRLALVAKDVSQAPKLTDALLTEPLDYVSCILDALRPHRSDLLSRFWRELRDTSARADRRFRAGLALADYAKSSRVWCRNDYRFIAEQLVAADPEQQPRLREHLRPINENLLGELERVFTDPNASETERMGAANAVADFAGTNRALITRLLCVATPSQYERLFPLIAASADEETKGFLTQLARQEPAEDLSLSDRVLLGRRRAAMRHPFAILDRELTFAELVAYDPQFAVVMEQYGADPSHVGWCSSWYDSVRFCRWLTQKAGLPEEKQAYPDPESLDTREYPLVSDSRGRRAPRNWPIRLDRPGFRLPTDAEWEVACRAGTRTTYGFGGDVGLFPYYGWSVENIAGRVPKPKRLRPNMRGLFDAHGNLIEWCHNMYKHDPRPEGISPDLGSDSDRVIRGGGWDCPAVWCRSAHRARFSPTNRTNDIGFRIVLTLLDEPNSTRESDR